MNNSKRSHLSIILILIFLLNNVSLSFASNMSFSLRRPTPTGFIGETSDFVPYAIDDLVLLKGRNLFHEKGVGAHYYAFTEYSTKYQEAFANIKLPTKYNNANNTRNGYIALGIFGSKHGIDLGLKNDGKGWYPCSYDVGHEFLQYDDYRAPQNATNAKIVVKPLNTSTVNMYIQFIDKSGRNVGRTFNKNISVKEGNLTRKNGKILCRFYRFASLVNLEHISDNQMDSSYMIGGEFTNLRIYERNRGYVDWGINTRTITNAWLCSPERIKVNYNRITDKFTIDHWYKSNRSSLLNNQ